MLTLDAHCDSPSQMFRLRDFSQDNKHAQVDFPKMKKGGVDCSFFALYIPARLSVTEAREYAWKLFYSVELQVSGAGPDSPSPDRCMASLALSSSEVAENSRNGRLSIMLGLENGSPLGSDFQALYEFYGKGVRYVTLTHSRDNQIGDSCTGNSTWGGLSPFGRSLVKEMNSCGMVIDLAHASDNTVRDVLSLTDSPVVFTHGCCRSLCNHPRNLPDDLMRGIAASGGVMGISIYPAFLSEDFPKVLSDSGLDKNLWIEDEFIADPSSESKREAWWQLQEDLSRLCRPGVQRVVDHIEHAVDVCGVEHVGIGTDYDGIEVTADGLEQISGLPLVWNEMRRRGWSESDISSVAGGNFIRIFK